jgi:hypothetical protein
VSLPAGLPAYPVLIRALRTTTERLARELAVPSPDPPAWSAMEWDVARAVVAMQGTTALLANRLRWRGPDSWQAFLTTGRDLAVQRDARITASLARLHEALREASIGCVALKGSALRALDIYLPGERPMGDIDLLARPTESARVVQVLESLDYVGSYRVRRHAVFLPRSNAVVRALGEHPDNPIKVELHERIAEPLPISAIDITHSLWPRDAHRGLVAYPHARELVRHLLLHAGGNIRAHALRQIQLHDIAMLGGRLTEEDWQALLETPESRGGSWWMWPVLELVAQYYPRAMAPRWNEFRARCPRLLRATSRRNTLFSVSWSNLRIAAFPGLSWARSPREALSFVRSRLLPRREALDELDKALRSMPTLDTVPWYGENHLTRVLRWISSRPPRVQTVRALLDAIVPGPQGP